MEIGKMMMGGGKHIERFVYNRYKIGVAIRDTNVSDTVYSTWGPRFYNNYYIGTDQKIVLYNEVSIAFPTRDQYNSNPNLFDDRLKTLSGAYIEKNGIPNSDYLYEINSIPKWGFDEYTYISFYCDCYNVVKTDMRCVVLDDERTGEFNMGDYYYSPLTIS